MLVSNVDGSVVSAAATLTVDPVSYGRWTSLTFGAESGPLVQPDGDYNGDGIPNFLDFAFGVQPALESGVGAQPSASRDAFGTHTVVAVRVPAPNPGAFFKLEVSGP